MTSQVLLQIIQNRLHSQGLSQAGVLSVCLALLSDCLIVYESFYRCTALPSNIDGLHGRRTRAFTDKLLDTLDSKTLWDEYGIDNDIMVSTSFQLLITFYHSDCKLAALYSWLSMSQHLWNSNTRLASSSYKRNLQGPSHHLGQQVSRPWTWRNKSKWNSWRHWQAVCFLTVIIYYFNKIK